MHDFTTDELMELIDIATNALEALARKGNKTAIAALEEFAHRQMEMMENI